MNAIDDNYQRETAFAIELLKVVLSFYNGVTFEQLFESYREDRPFIVGSSAFREQEDFRDAIGLYYDWWNSFGLVDSEQHNRFIDEFNQQKDDPIDLNDGRVDSIMKTQLFQELLRISFDVQARNGVPFTEEQMNRISDYLAEDSRIYGFIEHEKWYRNLTDEELLIYACFNELDKVFVLDNYYGKYRLERRSDVVLGISQTDPDYLEKVREFVGEMPKLTQEQRVTFYTKLKTRYCLVEDPESSAIVHSCELFKKLLQENVQAYRDGSYNLKIHKLINYILAPGGEEDFVELISEHRELDRQSISEFIELIEALSKYPKVQSKVFDVLLAKKNLVVRFDYFLKLVKVLEGNVLVQSRASDLLVKYMQDVTELDPKVREVVEKYFSDVFKATKNNTSAQVNLARFARKFKIRLNFSDFVGSFNPIDFNNVGFVGVEGFNSHAIAIWFGVDRVDLISNTRLVGFFPNTDANGQITPKDSYNQVIAQARHGISRG